MKPPRKKLKESTVGNLVVFVGLILMVSSFLAPGVGTKDALFGFALVVIGCSTNVIKYLHAIGTTLGEIADKDCLNTSDEKAGEGD
jgi:hypothetical protein